MVKGLYTAYTGMVQQQKRMEVVTNNLANSDTNGFKKEGATSVSFADVYAAKIKDESEFFNNRRIGTMNMGAKIGETYTNFDEGPIEVTDNDYDFALDGKGFFQISYTNKAGETSTKYTRDGSFTLTQEGYLVTDDGDLVLGQNGPIRLDVNSETKVDTLGNIYQNDQLVDRFALVDFADYNYLSHYGENLYDAVDGATAQNAPCTVVQGVLEASNINVVEEMVSMIEIQRNYESNQKVIQSIDETLDKAVNQVGRL